MAKFEIEQKVMFNGEVFTIQTSTKDFRTGRISYRLKESGALVNESEISEIGDTKKQAFAKKLIELEVTSTIKRTKKLPKK